MPFAIVRQDITKMHVDAIVNAANTSLLMGGGVCGAIFRAAGEHKLQAACDKLAPIHTGEAVITPGFKLPAKYVIHAVGPIYSRENAAKCERLLRSAYSESLRIARENGCESIAFPLISSGIFGYPKDEALKVATRAIGDFLDECDEDMNVYLAVFDRAAFAVSKELADNVASYIGENYVEEHYDAQSQLLSLEIEGLKKFARVDDSNIRARNRRAVVFELDVDSRQEARASEAEADQTELMCEIGEPQSLEDLIGNLDEPFNETLLRLIDAKGKTDTEVYKRANIDRKLFSKIRTGKDYTPGKKTIIALAIALELSLAETEDLLERAGYALSHSRIFDTIIEYFILNRRYDIYEINEILFKYDQPLLA